MDYLDPKKQFRHRIILYLGYVLIGIAIMIGTLVLVYQAYGFGLGKNRTVIQSGLIFFSSQPHPANIYVNGTLKPAKTNTRLSLPAGIYSVQLKRDGYRNWQRTIDLTGGRIANFDYPFLFPVTLTPKKIQSYTTAPGLSTQSPNRRWLLVEQPGTFINFEVYDLKNPTKPAAASPLSLPANLLTKATGSESWQLDEWADDNQHVLLQHLYDGKTEFILVDRADPAQSLNLNSSLALPSSGATVSLISKKYDQYYIFNGAAATLQTASLKAPALQPHLEHVLSYRSYSDNTVLYVTDSGAPAGKVQVKLLNGNKTSNIRTFPVGSAYLLDLTEYSGKLYIAASASTENKVYIYRDPLGQLAAMPNHALVPAQVLHVTAPNYLSFSDNTQFIVAENATEFGVYDLRNKTGYHYFAPQPLDAPELHASWMDGHRLTYVSGGKVTVFDYDNANRQVLIPADSRFSIAFPPDYKYVYGLAPGSSAGQLDMTQTPLQTNLK